jgi:hypothetical protein
VRDSWAVNLRIALVSTLLLFPAVSSAQLYDFDAVVAGYHSDSCSGLPEIPPIKNGLAWVQEDASDPAFFESFTSFAAASADGRRVFGLDDRFAAPGFDVLLHSGLFVHSVFYGNDDYEPVTIAQAKSGRLFVVGQQGANGTLLVISTEAQLETTYPIPLTPQLAVGPDDCTLYYPVGGSVERMNGCTGAPLAPLATIGTMIHDVYPVADGTMLVAVDGAVLLLNATGTVVRTIPLTNYGFTSTTVAAQVAMGADHFLYVVVGDCEVDGDAPVLLRIAFDDGTELRRMALDRLTTANSLVLGAATEAIPTASDWVLLILAATIAVAGAIILRAR